MITGRAWAFGNNVNTDLMAPARLLKRPVAEYAAHCMEALQPNFAREVKPGDIVVGGINFGCGSSREQAPESLKYLGVAAVVAKRFARTFYRNAMKIGLPAMVCGDADAIPQGAKLGLDRKRHHRKPGFRQEIPVRGDSRAPHDDAERRRVAGKSGTEEMFGLGDRYGGR